MMSDHAAKGLLQSGATVKRFDQVAIKGFAKWFTDAAVFTYSLTDQLHIKMSSYIRMALSKEMDAQEARAAKPKDKRSFDAETRL
jgi:hypothetical protein